MKLGDFFIQLGVAADTKTLKDFAGSLGDMSVSAASALLGLADVEYKLAQLATRAMNTAVAFQMFETQTGLSSQELQRWQIVAEQANVSTDAVATSIIALERQMADIRLGRGNISPFQMLGISPYQNAFSVLNQLRQRLQGMNPATAANMIGQMGLSPDMLRLLTLSETKWREYSSTVRGMTTEQTEQFLKLKETLVQFGLVIRYSGIDMLSALLTHLTNLSDVLPRLTGGLGQLRDVFIAIGIAMFPLPALFGLLFLLLDDLAVYMQGGDSVIGREMKALATIFDEPIASGKVLLDLLQKITGFNGVAPGMPAGIGGIMPYGKVGAAAAPIVFNVTVNAVADGAKELGTALAHELKIIFGAAEQQLDNLGH